MNYVLIDKEKIQALLSDTRIEILRNINERPYTVSELSEKLAMAKSTISIHLDKLEEAGFIVQKDEGRKWKYYHLTKSGREIILGKSITKPLAFLLSISFALFVTGFILVQIIAGAIQYAATHPTDDSFDHEFSTSFFPFMQLIVIGLVTFVLVSAIILGILWLLNTRKILK